MTLGVAQGDLGGIQFITRRNHLHRAARRHPSTPFQHRKGNSAGRLEFQTPDHTLSDENYLFYEEKSRCWWGWEVGDEGAPRLHCYSLHFDYNLKSLSLNKGNTSVSWLCGHRSHLASFSSSAIRMVIKLFKVSPKIFENQKPVQSQGFFYFISPLPTLLPCSHRHPTCILFFLL